MPRYEFNGQVFELRYPAVMGILNLTPDSFSDGGSFVDPEVALEHALSMVEAGAQIIDLGGESTRPGSDPVSEEEELARVLPVLEKLPTDQFVLSIDTTKPTVARAALQAGAHVINDVSGGNPELLDLAQSHRAGFVLMHAQGSPKNMQDQPEYDRRWKSGLFLIRKKNELLGKLPPFGSTGNPDSKSLEQPRTDA